MDARNLDSFCRTSRKGHPKSGRGFRCVEERNGMSRKKNRKRRVARKERYASKNKQRDLERKERRRGPLLSRTEVEARQG